MMKKLLAFFTEALLACPVYPLELHQRELLKGPSMTMANSSQNQWAGRTTLASGQATVTVSTIQVQSDCLIFATPMHVTAQNSGFGGGVCVRSISEGNSFVLGWTDAVGRAFDATIMWEMRRTR